MTQAGSGEGSGGGFISHWNRGPWRQRAGLGSGFLVLCDGSSSSTLKHSHIFFCDVGHLSCNSVTTGAGALHSSVGVGLGVGSGTKLPCLSVCLCLSANSAALAAGWWGRASSLLLILHHGTCLHFLQYAGSC